MVNNLINSNNSNIKHGHPATWLFFQTTMLPIPASVIILHKFQNIQFPETWI